MKKKTTFWFFSTIRIPVYGKTKPFVLKLRNPPKNETWQVWPWSGKSSIKLQRKKELKQRDQSILVPYWHISESEDFECEIEKTGIAIESFRTRINLSSEIMITEVTPVVAERKTFWKKTFSDLIESFFTIVACQQPNVSCKSNEFPNGYVCTSKNPLILN